MKYVPSAFVGRLSRSAGSTTAGHNRYGAYFRNRTIPTNPVTPYQTAQRSSLADASAAWRTLTDVQRSSWESQAASRPRSDSLGQSYVMTGLQAYVSTARNMVTMGGDALAEAPAWSPPAAPVIDTIVADDSANSIVINLVTPIDTGAGEVLVVEATRPLSPGINFQQRGAYKQVFVGAPEDMAPMVTITTGYTSRFGGIAIGEKILFRFWVINANGQASTVVTGSVIATA